MNDRLRYVLFLSLGCLCLSGCLIPYAYPKLDYVPECDLGIEAADCHIFRVNVAALQEDIGEKDAYTIIEIPRRSDGTFPAQFGLAINRGFYVANPALSFNVGCLHSTSVRLYRPGYHLIELKPWDLEAKISWKRCVSLIEEENAIDAILQRPTVTRGGAFRNNNDAGLSDSIKTVRFAAAEYERIALLAPAPEDGLRLRNKAIQLLNPKSIRNEER